MCSFFHTAENLKTCGKYATPALTHLRCLRRTQKWIWVIYPSIFQSLVFKIKLFSIYAGYFRMKLAGTNFQNFRVITNNIKNSRRQIYQYFPLQPAKHMYHCTKCRMSIITMIRHFLKANRTKNTHIQYKTNTFTAVRFSFPVLHYLWLVLLPPQITG